MIFEEDNKLAKDLMVQNLLDKLKYERFLKLLRETQRISTEILVEELEISDAIVKKTIASSFSIPDLTLNEGNITLSEQMISETTCLKYRLIPVTLTGNELTVAFITPPYKSVVDVIKLESKKMIIPVVISLSNYKELIRTSRKEVVAQKIAEKFDITNYDLKKVGREKLLELQKFGKMPTIESVLNEIIIRAINSDAQDVHFELFENELRIRIDRFGVLERLVSFPKEFGDLFSNVLKTKANLNVFEKKKPQEGIFYVNYGGKGIDVRVATIPTFFGERIALRLFLRSSAIRPIEDLGIANKDLEKIFYILKKPSGLVLITGPSSSGKSSSLYAIVNELNLPEKNIMTLENPIEFILEFASQIEINSETSMTYSEALRSILKHRPNVIMLGEIIDNETGTLATQAALNGSLVLSTMLSNNAIGTIPRLLQLGIPSHWLAPTLSAIIYQQLVRIICPDCKHEYTPSQEELNRLGIVNINMELKFFRGRGCQNCHETGYSGRTIIYEILVIDEKIRELIFQNATISKIKSAALENGFKSIRYDALKKILIGTTTSAEVQRVLG